MAWNIKTGRQITPDLEVLRHQVNAEVTASIVIDASSVASGADGVRKLVAGTPMTKNSNNQYERYTGSAGQSAQKIVVVGTGGDFTLTVATPSGNQTTAAITFNPTAALIATRLEALAAITDVEVTGTGTALDPFIVTFVEKGEAGAVTATSSLTGPSAGVTITRATPAVIGILCATEVFPDGTHKSDLPSAIWVHGQWFRPDRIVDWATLSTDIKAALPTCKFS